MHGVIALLSDLFNYNRDCSRLLCRCESCAKKQVVTVPTETTPPAIITSSTGQTTKDSGCPETCDLGDGQGTLSCEVHVKAGSGTCAALISLGCDCGKYVQ